MSVTAKDQPKLSNGRDPHPPAMDAPLPDAPPAPRKPTDAQVQEGLVRSQRVFLAVGEVVSVLMRSRQYRTASLADIHRMIVPAISAEQYLIARAYSPATGLTTPVAVALWARVSETVDQRLCQLDDGPTELAPEEWVSGDIPWLVAYLGDPGAINQMLEVLQVKTLEGRALKVRTKDKDGRTVVRAFTPVKDRPLQPA